MILTKTADNRADLDYFERERISTGGTDSFILIVPTNRKSRYKKKEIISSSPGNITGRLNVETITTFTAKILFDGRSEKNLILTEAASAVLLKQSFAQFKPKYFSKYKNGIPAGTVNRIKNVISEYKKHGISPGVLRSEIKNLSSSEKLKAEDIADVYEIYRNKCRELNAYEIGDLYEMLNSLNDDDFAAKFRKLYPKVNLILVNGFDEFTSPEIEIINKAAELNNINLYLGFDYYRGNEAVFSHLDDCYDKLKFRGFKEIADYSPLQMNGFHKIVRENLFNKKEPNEGFKDNITLIEARSRSEEVELIAKEIKELISEKKVKPDSISVVYNLIQNYSDLLRDIFELYNIPYNLTDRYALNTSQPVISVINFLEILEQDFFYKNIFRALSGGYIKIPEVDLSNLLRVSVNLKIISGLYNWCNQLKSILLPAEDEFNGETKYLGRIYYQKALEDIERISKLLAPFNKKLAIDEFRLEIKRLLFTLDIPVNVLNNGGKSVEKNVKAVSYFIEIVDEMLDLLKLEYGTGNRYDLTFFIENIRTALTAARYNVKEKPGYGVQITTLNEIRGLKFDYLFVAGLCDGDLPTRYQPEIFFSGKYAKKEARHQIEERYLFYQSLCSWQQHLYLTYPLQDEKAELSMSIFLKEFINSFSTGKKNSSFYNESVYSVDSLIRLYGRSRNKEIEKLVSASGADKEHIDKAIVVNDIRQHDTDYNSVYSGCLTEGLSEIEKQKVLDLKSAEYSTTQLESYAKCPYQYFAQRILKLEPPEEPTEELESLEIGSLLHKILYEFYSEIHTMGIKLAGCSDADFQKAGELLFEIAQSKIDELQFSSPVNFFEKEKILGAEGDKEKSLLFMFLNTERESNTGFIPELFEAGFGRLKNPDSDSMPREFRAGEVKIRGKIDRIDINRTNGQYKIVDYKLGGKAIPADDLNNGIALQLPLYMYAAKELIKAQLGIDTVPVSAEIYSLKFKLGDFGRKAIKPVQTRTKLSEEETIAGNNKIIEICLDAVNKYVDLIADGKFNLSRLKDRDSKVCRFCSFKAICRITELH